jgi:hypothetical protein
MGHIAYTVEVRNSSEILAEDLKGRDLDVDGRKMLEVT